MIPAAKICIVRLGGLGDVVNTLPALDALRAACPNAHIAWLVEAPWNHILPPPPRLDEIITLPKNEWLAKLRSPADIFLLPAELADFVRRLRAKQFDLAIDFHGNLRSGITTFFTGAPIRAGFAAGYGKELNHFFTNRRFETGAGRIHRVDRSLALARAIGAPPVGDTPKIDLPDAVVAAARAALDAAGLGRRPLAAIHPGTSKFGAYKRWPVDRYPDVIRRLAERGCQSLITWGPGEQALAAAAAAGTDAVIAPPTQSVLDLCGILSLCDVFIGPDTGPALLAAAVDTPPVVMFGPKDPAVYAPRHPRTRIVEVPLHCRPCTKRTCDDPKCMLHITVRQVVDAAFALLDEMEGN